MGRSQRHMLWEQGATAAGEIHAQGMVAPGIAMQVNPEAMNELRAGPPLWNMPTNLEEPPTEADAVEVPVGEPGGPLSGSTLTGAIPESLEPEPPEPQPDEAPTITSLEPNTAVLGSEDFPLHVMGTGFTPESVILFADQPEPIVYISAEEITTIVKPSLPWGAVTLPVQVQEGELVSNTMDFVFTAAPEGSRSGERIFPSEPITIGRIEDHPDGLALQLAGGDVRIGDDVLVEATGSTNVNGSYTVLAIENGLVVIDSNVTLDQPIEGKGRLTVNSGN
jgi:hypothetical protein